MQASEQGRRLQEGVALQTSGRFSEAEYKYQLVLKSNPQNPDALNLMGTLATEAKRLDLSIDYLRRAVKQQPRNAIFRNNLGHSLFLINDFTAALIQLKKALSLDPGFEDAHLNASKTLRALGKVDDAVKYCNLALENKPESFRALRSKAEALAERGDLSEAADTYRKVIALKPTDVQSYVGLSMSVKFTREEHELEQVERLLLEADLSEIDRQSLHHVAGKINEDLARYDEAFDHFVRGKPLDRGGFKIDEYRDRFRKISALMDETFFEGAKGLGSDSNRPILIIGMPRSGTTLVEQILASHPDIHGAGEITDFNTIAERVWKTIRGAGSPSEALSGLNRREVKRLASSYLNSLKKYNRKTPYVTDKTPHNFEFLGTFALLFPTARIIHCVRDPLDTCMSCFSLQFNATRGYNSSLELLGEFYCEYKNLMDHWKRVLPNQIIDVCYEELVGAPEEVTRKLINFLGVEWNDSCLSFQGTARQVATPSRWQVRQPVYSTSIGRWRRYATHLAPLQERLARLI